MGEIRIGTVSSTDSENGMASVIYEDMGGLVTQMLPLLSFNDEYKMPTVGQKVLVAHLSNGAEMGVVLGGFWNAANAPGKDKAYFKKLGENASVSYDSKTETLTVSAKNIILEADGKRVDISEI